MPELVRIILYAMAGGLVGSVLGGFIAICVKNPSKNLIGMAFAFASAVLLALVFIDFIPHALGHGHYHTVFDPDTNDWTEIWYQHSGVGIWLTLLGLVLGIGLIFLLKFFDKHEHEHMHGIFPHNECCTHAKELEKEGDCEKTCETKSPRRQKKSLLDMANQPTPADRKRMIAIAAVVALAITLHDLPKGLAIGASGSIITALIIGLGCLPEGMAIAVPLKAGRVKNWKIMAVCTAAGFATVVGAILGYLLGGISATASGIIFALVAGSILGIVLMEMLPLAYEYSKNRKLQVLAMCLGVLLVIILNYFLHDFAH